MKLDIWTHEHRHGTDVYPIFRPDGQLSTEDDAIKKINESYSEFEPDRDETLELALSELDVPPDENSVRAIELVRAILHLYRLTNENCQRPLSGADLVEQLGLYEQDMVEILRDGGVRMKLLATIRHTDPAREDRVQLVDNGTGNVWAFAGDEDVYETDTPLEHLTSAWGGDEWDLRIELDGETVWDSESDEL